MISKILAAMVGLVVPAALNAQTANVAGFQNGNQLLQLCQPPDVVACTSYIVGTFDTVLVVETELLKTRIIAEPTICKPHGLRWVKCAASLFNTWNRIPKFATLAQLAWFWMPFVRRLTAERHKARSTTRPATHAAPVNCRTF